MAKKKKPTKKKSTAKATEAVPLFDTNTPQNNKPEKAPPEDERDPVLLAIMDEANEAPPGLGYRSLRAPPIPDDAISFPKEIEEQMKKRPELANLRTMWVAVYKAARQDGYMEGANAGVDGIRNNAKFWRAYQDQIGNAATMERERWERGGHGPQCLAKTNGKGKAAYIEPGSDNDAEDQPTAKYESLFDLAEDLDPALAMNPLIHDPQFLEALQERLAEERFSGEFDEREAWVSKGRGDKCFECPKTESREVQTDPVEPPPKPCPVYTDIHQVSPGFRPLGDFSWADEVEDLPIIPMFPPS